MSSISLPRVLQPKKANSLDLERENFEKSQAISVSKAINNQENPVKEKHVRSTIIGTFQEKGAAIFWSIVTKLPLQGNPIVCWKFCHTLHKILREGHPKAITDSQKYRNEIVSLGKLWGHLKEGYGKLIACYAKLLVVKLDFHKRNPRFPGNLQLTAEQLDDIGERDVNNYFQLTVEMFDYMDEILNLQLAIFGSLDMSRSNSMTSTGQCRLAPLIPCIQDSSQLYDYCVKLLFKLHSSLSPDTLIGHSDRFRKQFYLLRQFYLNSSTLQYFKYLIQIPLLPDNPPNFLVQADLSSHMSPVVILPEQADTPDNESVDMSLVDTSSADLLGMGDSVHRNGSIASDQSSEKDKLIEQLLHEIEELRLENRRIQIEDQRAMDDLRRQILALESQIAELQRELHEKNEELNMLRLKTSEETGQQAEAINRAAEAEKKSKASEEKFLKMKDVYTKLREEHIALIRTKADIEKQYTGALKASEDAQRIKMEMEEKLQKTLTEKMIAEEVLQKSSNESSQHLAEALSAKEFLEMKTRDLEGELETAQKEKSSLADNLNQLQSEKAELEKRLSESERSHLEKQNTILKEAENNQIKLLVSCLEEAERIIQNALEEFENPGFSSLKCTPEYLLTLVEPLLQSLDKMKFGHDHFISSNSMDSLLRSIGSFGHLLAQCLLDGKATANSSPDIEQGDKLTNICRAAGKDALDLLQKLKGKETQNEVPGGIENVKSHLKEITALGEAMLSKMTRPEDLSEFVEDELQSMDKAIEEAARRFEDLIAKSRENASGIKLEVNGKIIDACTMLMQAVRVLVQKSKSLQEEIVGQGKGTASAKEFYKRNHRWTEGLISAAKAVGLGAKFLVDAADKVLSGEAKFEELMVASQEIAASTAQLVIASKVKAERGSQNLSNLSQASKGVSEATGNVVATAKSCAQMMEDSDVMDFSKLSLHQAKRLEMESQVRLLELENQLTKERVKLSSLRKQHYMLAGESEGWEEEDIPK